MNEIKEFLAKYDSAVEAVENDAETAGKLACERVGWRVIEKNDCLIWVNGYSQTPVSKIADSISIIHELEKAVIEKVGELKYATAIYTVIFYAASIESYLESLKYNGWGTEWRLSDKALIRIATADAKTRLAAILLCLSEEK